MTNLSDLFPAGAGKQVSFVADGAIGAAGKPVILNGAGTVSPVGESTGSESLGSPVVASATTTAYGNSAVYDAASGKMVLVYNGKAPTNDTWAVVGTISGTVISWGTPVNVSGTITPDDHPQICYDPVTEQVIIAYAVQSAQTYVITGKVSGTTISFGTAVSVDSTANARAFTVAYNVADSKGLVIYGFPYEGSNGGRAKVITVSGTAISLGAVNNWNTGSGSGLEFFHACYDSNAEKIVLARKQGDGDAAVFTISGTTVSAGSFTQYSTGGVTNTSITYDAVSQKVVTASSESGSPYGTASVGTVSGTSISFGTPVTFESGAITAASVGCAYGGTAAGAVTNITFSPTSDNYMRYINGTVSGTSISFNTAARAFSDNATTSRGGASTATEGKVLIRIAPSSTVGALVDNYVSGAVLQNVATTTNLTATNFIGISDAAILDTASGNITIKGGIAATGLTSLTPGSDYYAQDDGTITTASAGKKIGKAMSATSINLEYQS